MVIWGIDFAAKTAIPREPQDELTMTFTREQWTAMLTAAKYWQERNGSKYVAPDGAMFVQAYEPMDDELFQFEISDELVARWPEKSRNLLSPTPWPNIPISSRYRSERIWNRLVAQHGVEGARSLVLADGDCA